MSKDTTYSGKNIETAVAKAAKATGAKPEDLKYQILAGKGGGFALIKVTSGAAKSTTTTKAMVEKLSGTGPSPGGDRDDGPRRDRGDRDGGDRGDRGRGRGDSDRGGRGDRDRGGDRGGRGGDRGGRDKDRGGRGGDRGGRGGDRGGRGGDRGGRGGERGGRGRREEIEVPQDGPIEVEVLVAAGAKLGELGEATKVAISELLGHMKFGMSVTISENDDHVHVELASGVYHDAFMANDMELLDALEHLTDKIANRDIEGRKKVHLDSQGAKAKADLDLGQSATQMAERAIEEGRTIKIGPLDPRSRRVVHMTLKEFEGVATRSEGEGVFRRVCIIPKKKTVQHGEEE